MAASSPRTCQDEVILNGFPLFGGYVPLSSLSIASAANGLFGPLSNGPRRPLLPSGPFRRLALSRIHSLPAFLCYDPLVLSSHAPPLDRLLAAQLVQVKLGCVPRCVKGLGDADNQTHLDPPLLKEIEN